MHLRQRDLKTLEPALDCLHKLIAYDHLEGDPGVDGGKNVPLFTDILNMVCCSIDNLLPDNTKVISIGSTLEIHSINRVRNKLAK